MAKKQAEVSEKQLEVFKYLIAYIQDNGFQPSVAEMAVHFNVSKRAVLDRLQLLEEKGFIRCGKSKDRAIEFPMIKFKAVQQQSQDDVDGEKS